MSDRPRLNVGCKTCNRPMWLVQTIKDTPEERIDRYEGDEQCGHNTLIRWREDRIEHYDKERVSVVSVDPPYILLTVDGEAVV